MRFASLISGGKDSIYATYSISKKNELSAMIGVESEKYSKMFHFPNVNLIKEIGRAIGKPLIYEKEDDGVLDKTIRRAKEEYDIEMIVSGALASNYQRERIDKACERYGLKSSHPLWKIDVGEYMSQLISNFEVVIVSVAAEGFDESWLGKRIDKELLSKISDLNEKYKVHIGGEGGEYETLVLDCPLYDGRFEIEESNKVWEGNSGYLDIKEINYIS